MSDPMMQAVLKWSLSQVDGTRPSNPQPMPEERKQWLAEALKSMRVDPHQRMKAIAEIIKKPDPSRKSNLEASSLSSSSTSADLIQLSSPSISSQTTVVTTSSEGASKSLTVVSNDIDEQNAAAFALASYSSPSECVEDKEEEEEEPDLVKEKQNALEELEDHVGLIDFAQDLHKVGGFIPLIHTLKSEWASIRWRAAHAIGIVVQNNPVSQAWALQFGLLPSLIRLLRVDESMQVINSSLFALSCLIGSHDEARTRFLKAQGYTLLTKVLLNSRTTDRVKIKTVHLLTKIWSYAEHRKLSDASEVPSLLISSLSSPNIDLRESSLKAITQLVADSQVRSLLLSRKLAEALHARKTDIDSETDQETKDQCKDELNLLEELQNSLSS